MLKSLRLLVTFYKLFAFASWTITLSSIIIIHTWGLKAFTALFWFKIITLGLIIYFTNNYKKQEFYYYKNLGFSRNRLWISTLLFDFIMFITLMILTSKFR